jgi:uncharacterized protein
MEPTAPRIPRISPELGDKLAYYIFAFVDPRNSQIFYVGKGCRTRALAHLDEAGEFPALARIRELQAAGLQPQIDILAHGITSEDMALRIEAALIDALWPGKTITSRIHGYYSLELGRVPLSELEFQYAAKPIQITEPCLLFRINQLYRPGMSALALYEATRGVWTCAASRRNRARIALAVYHGVVREAYDIHEWYPAGTLEYKTRARAEVARPGRCEFSGAISEQLAPKYRGGSVHHYFSQGAQLPFTYVNC